jgi:hypothetical protein
MCHQRIILAIAVTLAGSNAAIKALDPDRASRDFVWIERRVAELQPTAKEKRFDEIGWANNLRSALQLARGHNRPVFLFTHDGRINTGRC